jgi:hypothetical protein
MTIPESDRCATCQGCGCGGCGNSGLESEAERTWAILIAWLEEHPPEDR